MKLRAALPLAAVLFFLSGALGLGYQLVWVRKAALLVGASQIALSTVLTSFFLGLGIGSWFVGRHLRSRRFSSLFVYGLFELAIGAFALAFPLLFAGVEGAYSALYPTLAGSPTALFALRFGLLFALFLVPTFFMGGTLPLLLDGLVERDESIGSLTSFLYGLNILGAVAGVLMTGYYAIPALGMNGTSWAAAMGNLLIGAVALLAFRRARPREATPAESLPASLGFYPILAFASGLATIGFQVSWARYFHLVMHSTAYLTAVLLAVFLAALAVGSMAMAPLFARRVSPLRVVAWLQPIAAIWVLVGYEAWVPAKYEIDSLADFSSTASWLFWGETADAIFFAPLLQVGLVVFGPVMLLGTALPSLIAAATEHRGELRASAGSLVFWNTLGSSAGGFIAGYVLIPTLGLTGAFAFSAAVSLSMAAAAEWRRGLQEGASGFLRPGYVLSAVAALAVAGFANGDVTKRTLLRHGAGSHLNKSTLLDIVEGPLTTAAAFDGPGRVVTTGLTTHAVIVYGIPSGQAIHGHLPALLYPKAGAPERVLGVALGSGQSFGALMRHPVKSLDVVDISGEITQIALRYFADLNHDLGSDPRVTFHLDDGRHFVERAASQSYDVVTMESPPPTTDGAFSLFSLEFYREVRRILREGGLFTQWLPLYHLTPNDLRGILKTHAAVFPHTFVVLVTPADLFITSFVDAAPPRLRTDWIEARAEIYARERHVRDWIWYPDCSEPIHTLNGVLASFVAGPEDVRALESAHVFEDDEQLLSYSSGDRHLLRRYGSRWKQISRLTFGAVPVTPFRELQRYFDAPIPVAHLERERACSLQEYNLLTTASWAEAERAYTEAQTRGSRARAALELSRLHARRMAFDDALSWIGRAAAQGVAPAGASGPAALREVAGLLQRPYGPELRGWIGSLPEAERASPVIGMLRIELDALISDPR